MLNDRGRFIISITSMEQLPTVNKILIYFIPIMTSLSSVVMGYFLVYFSMLDDYIRSIHNFQSQEEFDWYLTIATAILPAGAFVGSFFYQRITMNLGENVGMILMDVLAIISMGMQMITMWTPVLFLSRFLMGVYCAITLGVVPSFSLSISPKELSGISGSCNQLSLVTGMALAYLSSQILDSDVLSNKLSVAVYCGLPLLNNVIHIICLKFLPLSNVERILQLRKSNEFASYMKILYGKDWRKYERQVRRYKMIPIELPVTSSQIEKQGKTQQQQLQRQESAQISKKTEEKKEEKFTVEKFKEKYIHCKFKRSKVLSIMMAIASQITGFFAILQFSKQLFENLQQDEGQAENSVLILGFFQICANLLGSILINKYGRRQMMMIGLIIITLSLFLSSLSSAIYSHNFGTVVLIFIYVLGYGISLGPLCIMYTIQILTDLRLVLSIYWGMMFIVTVATDILIEETSGTWMFFTFGVFSLLCFVFFYYRMIQTKGVNKKQIKELIQQQTFQWEDSKILRKTKAKEIEDKVQTNFNEVAQI